MSEQPTHFENPLIEQRALWEGKATIHWVNRAVISVTGENKLTWLHALLSQDFANLKPGQSTEALLLDPKGHIEQAIRATLTEDTLWLTVPEGKGPALLEWLRKMVFRSKVEIIDRSEEFELIGAFANFAELEGMPVWVDPWPGVCVGGVRYNPELPEFAYREWLVPKGTPAPGMAAGSMSYEGLRLWAGRPAIEDVDDRSLPHEFDWLSTAVHMNKGCYRGQETVAKVHNLGHPPRRLTLLHLDSAEILPEVGAELRVSGTEQVRGQVVAAAQHFEAGPIALALVQRSVDPAAQLAVGGAHATAIATQQLLVPSDAGRAAPPPKMARLNLGAKR